MIWYAPRCKYFMPAAYLMHYRPLFNYSQILSTSTNQELMSLHMYRFLPSLSHRIQKYKNTMLCGPSPTPTCCLKIRSEHYLPYITLYKFHSLNIYSVDWCHFNQVWLEWSFFSKNVVVNLIQSNTVQWENVIPYGAVRDEMTLKWKWWIEMTTRIMYGYNTY